MINYEFIFYDPRPEDNARDVETIVYAAAEATPAETTPALDAAEQTVVELLPDTMSESGRRSVMLSIEEFDVPEFMTTAAAIARKHGLWGIVLDQDKRLVFSAGDHETNFAFTTNDWFLPTGSPRLLSSWLHFVQDNFQEAEELGLLDGANYFLVAEDTRTEQHYMQTRVEVSGTFRVECREGSPEAHFCTHLDTLSEVETFFREWMTTGAKPGADWEHMDFS